MNKKQTKCHVTVLFQTHADAFISKMLSEWDFIQWWKIVREMPITFYTTSKVDEEYISNLKKSLIWKDDWELICCWLKDFLIEP